MDRLDARQGRATGIDHRLFGVVAALALVANLLLFGAAPVSAAPLAVENAAFAWGLSGEQGSGAFAGGCNFLSAGTAGSTGASRPWTEADGFYATQAGNVTIEKPDASGDYAQPTWATKCQDPNGNPVSAGSTTSFTLNRVVFSNGTGTVDPVANTASISWTGSFTSVFYGGFTYWSAANPVLTVNADGTGTLTATASGYGASMADPGVWIELTPRTITLGDLTGVDVTESGFTVTPDYLDVSVTVPSGFTPQAAKTTGNQAYWGSFPQSYVDFQLETGQSSYWYTSGGSRDPAKPTLPLVVSFTGEPGDPGDPGDPGPGEQEIEVTIPEAPGEFSWSIDGTGPVVLAEAVSQGSYWESTGAIHSVVVTDTRAGGPAWSISGQVADFTGGLSGAYLGWTPEVVSAGAGAAGGDEVVPGFPTGNGLLDSSLLASADEGHADGTATLGADLLLQAPIETGAGTYSTTLTLTALH